MLPKLPQRERQFPTLHDEAYPSNVKLLQTSECIFISRTCSRHVRTRMLLIQYLTPRLSSSKAAANVAPSVLAARTKIRSFAFSIEGRALANELQQRVNSF